MKKDIDNIKYLAQNMLGRTFCPLGDAAAIPTMSIVDKWRSEFEDHLDGKPCPFETEGKILSFRWWERTKHERTAQSGYTSSDR